MPEKAVRVELTPEEYELMLNCVEGADLFSADHERQIDELTAKLRAAREA